jgi:hypothetical protein
VDHAVDPHGRAGSQRDGEEDERDEARMLLQAPYAEAKIVKEGFHDVTHG